MNARSNEELVKQTIDDLEKTEGVLAVILYGSYARGTQTPISDVDVCVLTDKKISDKIKEGIVSHSSSKIEISLFWDLPPAVRYAVLKEGKVLFNRNEELLHAGTVETMSEYLDFKHIIDRNIARVFGT